MRYLGGKSRIAKEIAAVVAPKGVWWEPFCGGLSVSVQLAKYSPGVVSDANPALIALYQAVRDGWEPPTSVSREEYQAAKSLPDTDPRKAFIGFGCSFRAKWFGGYAPDQDCTVKTGSTKGNVKRNRPASAAAKALLLEIPAISSCVLQCLSFFDIDPRTSPAPECIYADPPYEGTTGYSAVGAFDHAKFWAYCGMWAVRGVRVFVSELSCPVNADRVWAKQHVHAIRGTGSDGVEESLFFIKAA